MKREEVATRISTFITQSLEGRTAESLKTDFKLEWYDLTSPRGINEFIKDTSAIANTYGPDGFIIIGFDDVKKTFKDTSFTDSKLTDTAYIPGLIKKRVDRLYNIEVFDITANEHNLSVLHIPPSLDKPHVVLNHQTFGYYGSVKREEVHRVFVRRGTTTEVATKNDFELMIFDKRNVLPEYKLIASFHYRSLSFGYDFDGNVGLPLKDQFIRIKSREGFKMIFENLGQRPVSFTKMEIDVYFRENPTNEMSITLNTLPCIILFL